MSRPSPEKMWRAIVAMAPAAGPAWTPRWVLDLLDDDDELPAELSDIPEAGDG